MLTFLLLLPELDPETIDFNHSQSTCFILVYYTFYFLTNVFVIITINNSLLVFIIFFRYSPNVSLHPHAHSNRCIENAYQCVCITHTYSREFIYYAHTHITRTHILECMNYIHMHESVHCAHTQECVHYSTHTRMRALRTHTLTGICVLHTRMRVSHTHLLECVYTHIYSRECIYHRHQMCALRTHTLTGIRV